jgi:ubiquinone/menaquinone biosynthesis C-methylase UbiE
MAQKKLKEYRRHTDFDLVSELDGKHLRDYTEEASNYDKARFSSFKGAFISDLEIRMVRRIVGSIPSDRVLDVATGTGRFSLALAKAGLDVTAVDLTANMLQEAKYKARHDQIASIHFRLANARHLPFADDTFDAVVSMRFLHLIPEDMQEDFIREMRRVLKPGGLLILGFSSPLYGLCWGLIREMQRRYVHREMAEGYLWPHRIKSKFRGLETVEIKGLYLPGLSRLAKFNKRFALWLSGLCAKSPIAWLSSTIIVKGTKPGATCLNRTALSVDRQEFS